GPKGYLPERPTIFLIHGAGGRAELFNCQRRDLDQEFNVCALELPGHGDTPGPGLDRVDAYASWVAAQLDKSGATPAALLGHSLGGAVAVTVALERPDLLTGLILMGTGAKLRVLPAILDGLVDRFSDTVTMIVDFAYGPSVSPREKALGLEQMKAAGPRTLLGDFTACNTFDAGDRLGEVKVPTLVLTGEGDRLTPVKYGQYLADNITHAKFQVIPGAGHLAMVERPDEVSAAVAEFLRGL
ncbi:MAG: alpha/beta hydrolase, partial [Proteobacteria bacterium]|nr:alpha/beta hydrolase [Pseudomonadota bacterium]